MAADSKVWRPHPCFDEEAHDSVGRVHLPVAPRCNIRCAYCERRVCADRSERRPGVTARLLDPVEAAALVRRLLPEVERRGSDPAGFVVGVAGPGEPLANEETFEALRLVHAEFPELTKCVSTNGLLLAEALPRLLAVGVRALTVTVNAGDPEVAEGVYAWVRCEGRLYRGRAAAELIIARQFAGLQAALGAGLRVKVNAVLIPGVNDAHLPALARRLAEAGVPLMNVMPLIPGGLMRDRRAPTCDELRAVRDACEAFLPQFRRCEQCRADVVRLGRPPRPRWAASSG